jgi:hypothetical protein
MSEITNLPEGAVAWACHEFKVEVDCTPFQPYQLSFMNKWGVRDYWTFTKRNTKQINTQKETYYRDLGTWSGTSFTANSWERGTKTFNQTGLVQMTLSTDWISQPRALFMEQLFTSPEVKIYYEGHWIAVDILTQTYDEKTWAREAGLIRYEIAIQFAVPKLRQRG